MTPTALDEMLAGLPRRRVLVVSDRYPPDAAGGAERSLHLMLREPALRDQVLVVSFDKALAEPVRRAVDGVETVALPAQAAFPLDRLSQAEADGLKERPFGLKWPAFAAAALRAILARPRERVTALALHMAARPPGGVAMDHATIPGGAMETALRLIVEHVRPALVHADNARAIITAAGALEGSAIPLVAAVRDHRFTRSGFDQSADVSMSGAGAWRDRAAALFANRALAFRRERLARADLVLVASAHLAEEVAALLPAGRVRRLPLTPVTPLPRASSPVAGFNVLIVGSLTPNKGQERFLGQWPAVCAQIPEATLDIAGGGPSFDALRSRIANLGIEGSVRLHGHVEGDALSALYAGCHVVALPTLWAEPFGRVPLEAGAAGRPVVAYAVGGHAETVVDGVTGRLVAPQDETGFVSALVEIARDDVVRKGQGEANWLQAAAFAPANLAGGLKGAWDTAQRETAGPARDEHRAAAALRDLVVVSSPLQYMNAFEWRRTRPERTADLVLLGDRAGGSDAIALMLARTPGLWRSVVRHSRRPKAPRWAPAVASDLADALHRASLRRFAARVASAGCSTLVFGDFRNQSQRELVARIAHDRLVLLDDGSITPQVARWRAGFAAPDPRRFADRWFRTAAARWLLGDAPASSPKAMTFFTIYASLVGAMAARTDEVERHAFEGWRGGDAIRRGDEVWLLGSNHVAARITNADAYERLISGGVAALREAGVSGPIVYRPHRDEDHAAAAPLAEALGMRLAMSPLPVELAYMDAEMKPAAVAVVASSAVDTLSVIDPGLALFRLQLPPDYLRRHEGHILAVISVHDAFIPHLRVLAPHNLAPPPKP